MSPLRIFISSAQKELAPERAALRDYLRGDALMRKFFKVFLFEDAPAADRRADAVYLSEVERCDIYPGLFGNDYGFEDAQGVSPTEREFDCATQLGKPRLIFVRGPDDSVRHSKMRALIRRAGDQLIRRRFTDNTDLKAAVYASLVEHLEHSGRLRMGPFDASACAGATTGDLDPARLRAFLARTQSTRGYPLAPNTPTADALAHLDLLDNGVPNHAAILLFGKKPQRPLPTSIVKCLHFHGTEVRKPIPSHQEYGGTVFELVDQAVDFVMSKIDRRVGTRAESNTAPVTYELPREAVSEAIVNAIAHRDYRSNASVQVMLFSDRLEIWNPGQLPPGLTPEKLTKAHASIPHNPLLAHPLFLAGYIERAGTGTLDMIALCREAGLPAPDFRQDGGMFIQTLSRPVARQTGQAAPQATVQVAMQDNGLIAKAFSEFVAALASQTGQVTGQAAGQAANALLNFFTTLRTAKEIQDFLGLSHRETFLNNYLNPAIEAGLLERTIPKKPTSPNQRYRLTAKGRAWLAKNKKNTEGLGHGE
jgi:predicted HTH transcriptional regulator